MNSRTLITVFEHETIKLGQKIDNLIFEKNHLLALQKYYGEKGVPYFSLIHNGVRFNEYVGVIQVGKIVFEILPKADNAFDKINEKKQWRDILIDMIFSVGVFDIHAPSSSLLKLKSNSILDLYFELFIREVEYLLHNGLVKNYRIKEGNVTALKGCLKFGKHIQQNLIHHERFYVQHTTYDVEHQLHFILYKAIRLLKLINTNSGLSSRIGALLLHFPEMPDLRISENVFERIVYTRKTQFYKKSIDIAKLLLLQYHPDVVNGKNNVLALMFDMNKLWEKFVFISLRKHKKPNTTITEQTSKGFWLPKGGVSSRIRPDIVINDKHEDCVVLDTKWKNLKGSNPSPDDLRQMYVYHEYYSANWVALIYPGIDSIQSGVYLKTKIEHEKNKHCCVISLSVHKDIKIWQKQISDRFQNWMLEIQIPDK